MTAWLRIRSCALRNLGLDKSVIGWYKVVLRDAIMFTRIEHLVLRGSLPKEINEDSGAGRAKKCTKMRNEATKLHKTKEVDLERSKYRTYFGTVLIPQGSGFRLLHRVLLNSVNVIAFGMS